MTKVGNSKVHPGITGESYSGSDCPLILTFVMFTLTFRDGL